MRGVRTKTTVSEAWRFDNWKGPNTFKWYADNTFRLRESESGPVVTHFSRPPKSRWIYRLPYGPTICFGAHDNSVDNLERAVLERVFLVKRDGEHVLPYQPGAEAWLDVQATSIEPLLYYLSPAKPLSKDQFPLQYDEPRKRQVYWNAVESLKREPISIRDSYISGFTKCEKTNFTLKPDPVPRLVSPRDPRYNVELGVFLKPIEHKVYHALDRLFRDSGCVADTVAKGHNFQRRAKVLHQKWRRFKRPVAFLFDAERFDQHISELALQSEHQVYLHMYADDPMLKQLLEWQLRTVFRGVCKDGCVTFTKVGGRCSGDMNTALGNVIIMCIMMHNYLKTIGVEKFELYDDGDDSVLIVESEDADLVRTTYRNHFIALGFSMVLGRECRVLEEVEFCQAHPVFDGKRWTMIRDPRVAIAKDCISTLPHPTEKVTRGWMAAVAQCGEAIAGGIPVWNSFYQLLLREAHGTKALRLPDLESGMQINARGMRRRFSNVTDEARVSFWRAFGWEPAMQIALEKEISTFGAIHGRCLVVHPPSSGVYTIHCPLSIPIGSTD